MTHILLVLPENHELLRSGPCGDRLPRASYIPSNTPKSCPTCQAKLRWFCSPTAQMDNCWICSVDWQHKFKQQDIYNYSWVAGERGGLSYDRVKMAIPLMWEGVVQTTACDAIIRRLELGMTIYSRYTDVDVQSILKLIRAKGSILSVEEIP